MIEVKEGWDLLKSEQVPVQKCKACSETPGRSCSCKKPSPAGSQSELRRVLSQEDA